MKIRSSVSVAMLVAAAGVANAQPTIDGVFDPGTEGSFYGDIIWENTVPTTFGDNVAGLFQGGNFGDPENVTTGVEFSIPLASLGLTGTETIRIGGWVNSGDRTFMSNQIIGSLPVDTGNLDGPDFTAIAGDQFISADLSAIAAAGATIDGSLGADSYTQVFLQGNYTGFGNETDGTEDGSGPNGGGSEIDAVYLAKDGTNLYVMVAGNLENNGNGLDLYFDTQAGGLSGTIGVGVSGDGAFIVEGQEGTVLDAGFEPDYVVSFDATDDDLDGGTPNVPRAFFGPELGPIDTQGTLAGFGAANAGTAGVLTFAIDNSNIVGVLGEQASPTPVSPDADWGYGSELNNVRTYLDEPNNRLYIFVGGNLENNSNKLSFFIDCQPGGQNPLRNDNIDISFNALNNQNGIAFDAGFEPDYWFNVNYFVDGGSGNLNNFTDAATLRTDGILLDPFFGVTIDYGCFFGGEVDTTQVMDFSGPRLDLQDGSLASIFANYAPRLTSADPDNPISGLLQTSLNNSNVGGVTDTTADSAAVRAVNTGIEICIDLDELGWDGAQDILMGGWISNSGFDFVSNQVFGDSPGADNVGPRDSDGDTVNDLDFGTIAGTQYINLFGPPVGGGCPADLFPVGAGDGVLNFLDLGQYLTTFGAMDPAADLFPVGAPDGQFNFLDLGQYLTLFGQGCP